MTDLLMCLSCGEFVETKEDGSLVVPLDGECPDCGGTRFKNNSTGEIIRIDE